MKLRTIYITAALAGLSFSGSASAQDTAAGERLFRARCGSCHAIQPGQNRVGPSLSGVIGRKAGSVEGVRYSPAMREAAITWDAAELDTYLTNPRAKVPGTTMTISVTNAGDRGAIVAYLETLTPAAN